MKLLTSLRVPMVAVLLSVLPAMAMAQDADKQKMMEIEKALSAHPNAGPDAGALLKQHLFDGTLIQLTGQGQVGALPKSRIVDLFSKPNPADPSFKSVQTL